MLLPVPSPIVRKLFTNTSHQSSLTTRADIAKWSTKRNNGVREAEMRLPALIPFVIITIITHIVGALGTQRHWPWQAIVVIGYSFSGIAVTTVPTIAIAYAIDCFKPISGEIMIIATIFKNTVSRA